MLTSKLITSVLCILFFISPSLAFQKSETSFFTFFYDTKDSKAVNILIRNADILAENISGMIGFRLEGKVKVVVSPTYRKFKKAQPRDSNIPGWAVGVAYPSKNLIIILNKNRVDLIKTFRHELTHIFLGQAFKGKEMVPRWLNEGLALIVADEWSISRLSTITGAVLTNSLIPMDEIASSFPYDLRDAELAYCQSFYFISFLKGKFGADLFKAFLKDYSKYKNFNYAIKKTYHISWDKMEGLWLDYMGLRFSWIPLITSTGFLWFIASIIFIAGYIRKKRNSRLMKQQWEAEERLLYDDED
jgi:hypothetical protein